MATLEDTVKKELVPVGPAKKAFSKVSGYFSTDKDLARALHERLNELNPENRIAFNTVRTSFTDKRNEVMDKRISDLIIEFDGFLKKYLDREGMEIERNDLVYDPRFLGYKRSEAHGFCREIAEMVGPLMDLYQFKSRKMLARYFSEQTGTIISEVVDIFSGDKREVLTPQIVYLRDQMSAMLRRARDGTQGAIPTWYLMIRKGSNQPESLNDFICRALTTLLGKEAQYDKRFVETKLGNLKYVGQVVHLLREVEKIYSYRNRKAGFMSKTSMHDFFFHIVDLEGRMDSSAFSPGSNIKGSGTPTNVHRKFYVIALILRDAAQRGIQVNMDANYLAVGKDEYLKLMNDMKRKGIAPDILRMSLSEILKTSEGSIDKILKGKKESIPLAWYQDMLKFRDARLDDIYAIDLTDEKRKHGEFERFKETYQGGRVLVKTNKMLTSDDRKMLAEIRDIACNKGFPFLYPTPRSRIREAEGYIHYNGLFRTPDSVKIQQAFAKK